MDEQQMFNQEAAVGLGRTAYMTQDSSGINTLLNDLTNVDIVLEEVELLLQGKVINEKGIPEQKMDPLLNEIGAANMKRFMKAQLSRVVLMSNFEEEQVRVMTIELGNDIIEDLTFNKKRYNIIQPKAIAAIEQLVLTNCFACAMSAMDNGTRQMLKKTTLETTVNTQGQGMKSSKGGFGSILGLGGKR